MTERVAWQLGKERIERLRREAALDHVVERSAAGTEPPARRSRTAAAARGLAAGLVRLADAIDGRQRPRLT